LGKLGLSLLLETFSSPSATGISILLAIILSQATFLSGGYLLTKLTGTVIESHYPSRDDLYEIAIAVIGSTLLMMVLLVLQVSFGLTAESELGTQQQAIWFTVGLFLLNIFLVAPSEEYLFRGGIQGTLRQSFGPAVSIFATSALFGLFHAANYSGSVPEVATSVTVIALVSVPFAIAYERTQNIVVPMAAHALYNSILIGNTLLSLF